MWRLNTTWEVCTITCAVLGSSYSTWQENKRSTRGPRIYPVSFCALQTDSLGDHRPSGQCRRTPSPFGMESTNRPKPSRISTTRHEFGSQPAARTPPSKERPARVHVQCLQVTIPYPIPIVRRRRPAPARACPFYLPAAREYSGLYWNACGCFACCPGSVCAKRVRQRQPQQQPNEVRRQSPPFHPT